MDYLEYFGFGAEPFSHAPVSRFYYASKQHTEALKRLMYATQTMKGLAILIGDIGHGKTTLARRLLDALPPAEFEAAMLVVVHAGVTATWLLKRIAEQLGVRDPSDDKLAVLSQLYARLLEIHKGGKRAVVIIDEAQMLARRELMEEFRGLLNLEVTEHKLISFVFFGLPDVERHLQLDPPLAQRVALRYHLRPLGIDETTAYVQHRLRLAGAKDELFPQAALAEVHRRTHGIPRVINTLCDNVLLELFFNKLAVATADIVGSVADNLQLSGRPEPEPSAAQREPEAVPDDDVGCVIAVERGDPDVALASPMMAVDPDAIAAGVALEAPSAGDGPGQAARMPRAVATNDIDDPLAFLGDPAGAGPSAVAALLAASLDTSPVPVSLALPSFVASRDEPPRDAPLGEAPPDFAIVLEGPPSGLAPSLEAALVSELAPDLEPDRVGDAAPRVEVAFELAPASGATGLLDVARDLASEPMPALGEGGSDVDAVTGDELADASLVGGREALPSAATAGEIDVSSIKPKLVVPAPALQGAAGGGGDARWPAVRSSASRQAQVTVRPPMTLPSPSSLDPPLAPAPDLGPSLPSPHLWSPSEPPEPPAATADLTAPGREPVTTFCEPPLELRSESLPPAVRPSSASIRTATGTIDLDAIDALLADIKRPAGR